MRILLAANSPYYPSLGGGNKSNRLLMEALARCGHLVRVASRTREFGARAQADLIQELVKRGVPCRQCAKTVEAVVGGVDVRILAGSSDIREFLASEIAAFGPDVILTSTDDPAHLMLDVALAAPDARVVYLIRATVALPFGPDSSLESAARTANLRRVDGAVGVSEHVAAYARRWGGLDAIHVPISLLEPREWPELGRFDNPFILMVNPCPVKGISIFLELADRLPGLSFAAIPSWGTSESDLRMLRARSNVSLLPPVEDMDPVYARTRIALVPSLWAEARSRIILEAMARGIPVLASRVGGLEEAMLGMDYLLPVNSVRRFKPGVDALMVPVAEIPPQDVTPWQAAVERLTSDRRHYEELSSRCRAAALAYASSLTVEPLDKYLQDLLKTPRLARHSAAVKPSQPLPAAPPLSPEKQKILALKLKRRLSSRAGWLPEALAERLSDPAARGELSKFATDAARQALPGVDIEIYWDGMWICRAGAYHLPLPKVFDGAQPDWASVASRPARWFKNAGDYWFHVYQPKPGDVIVDVGAGQGEDVLAFSAAVGPQGRVLAIEAHPESFAVLEAFCRLNGLANVSVVHVACMETAGAVSMETLDVWESNYVRAASSGAAQVAARTLDEVCAEWGAGRVDFLKMNIEGAERFALPGCRNVLERTRFVCVAAHDFRAHRGEGEEFRTFDFVCAFLRQAGFQLTVRDKDPRYFVPYHVHGFRTQFEGVTGGGLR